jgi:hypothetical protein
MGKSTISMAIFNKLVYKRVGFAFPIDFRDFHSSVTPQRRQSPVGHAWDEPSEVVFGTDRAPSRVGGCFDIV